MSSNDPVFTSASEGITKGLLNWTKEQVSEYIFKLKNKDVAFIRDKDDIELIRQQRKTAEWEIYSRFIEDKKLKILVELGLSLRKWESDPNKLVSVRTKISSKFTASGLHIAQFIQNDFLNKYLGAILAKVTSKSELTKNIEDILNNVDKYCVFVKEEDNVENRAKEIIIRIQANAPSTFILSSKKSAITVAKNIQNIVKKSINGYSSEEYQDNTRYICFFNKEEDTKNQF